MTAVASRCAARLRGLPAMKRSLASASDVSRLLLASNWAVCGIRCSRARLHKCQKSTGIVDQNRLDLTFGEAARTHERDNVLKDVSIAMAAERGQARSMADVVTDHDALQVTAFDEAADGSEPYGVVGHVYVGQPVEALLLTKQIKFDHASGIGQPEQLAVIEDRPIDVADNHAINGATVPGDEFSYLLRLLRYTPGVHIDGGAGLGLRDERPMQYPFLKVSPRNLAANLADDAGTDVRPPRTLEDLCDHLGGEAIH